MTGSERHVSGLVHWCKTVLTAKCTVNCWFRARTQRFVLWTRWWTNRGTLCLLRHKEICRWVIVSSRAALCYDLLRFIRARMNNILVYCAKCGYMHLVRRHHLLDYDSLLKRKDSSSGHTNGTRGTLCVTKLCLVQKINILLHCKISMEEDDKSSVDRT